MHGACVTGKDNIFDKIHRMRKVKNVLPTVIDDNESPPERFADVYGKLYNSVDDKKDIEKIFDQIQGSVNVNSLKDVDLVTPDLIRDVVGEIKSSKNDPVFSFNSDCIKRAPSSFHHHMANIIRLFLVHGHVSEILLIATIVPLLKDKQGDIQSSDNYRSIALSSVILKIFDWVVLTLFEEQLALDDLQFSYQKKCSTNMCTWMVVESINHFTRNKSNVYTCFMDMKKAFDMVKHGTIFKKLIERNVPPIFLRLLMVMYRTQSAKVKWNGILSDAFSISNGVKQGAVLSAILFCVYIDDLIKELRRKREGCWVNGAYVGIVVYADDIALLSPSLDGLQNMIDTCEKYAEQHNLTFSTNVNPVKSKTKCVAFLLNKRPLRNLQLKGKPLPWVNSIKHLGTTLTNGSCCNLEQDVLEKRAMFIAKNNELGQEFHYVHYKTKIWLNKVFNTSFYGAPLWDITSRSFGKLVKSWNVSARVMLNLPKTTHRYLIEPLTEDHHIVKSLHARFMKFVDTIENGRKEAPKRVMEMAQTDVRSTTGRNLRHLMLQTSNFDVKEIDPYDEPYEAIPASELWRIELVKDILAAKSGDVNSILNKDEMEDIAELACSK